MRRRATYYALGAVWLQLGVMASAASARLRWAVDAVDPQPDDRLLEVGCGHGVAAALVCERLDGGSVTAVDRSQKMIAAARKRTADCVGKARLVCATIEEADLGEEVYDKAFAVHVAALHKPGRALDTVRDRLAPDGRLYLFSQAPGWKTAAHARGFGAELRTSLPEGGVTVDELLVAELASGYAAGAVCSPISRRT